MSAGSMSTRRSVRSVGFAGAAAVIGRLRIALVDRRWRMVDLISCGASVVGRVIVHDGLQRAVGDVTGIVRVRIGHVALLRRLVGTGRTSSAGIQPRFGVLTVLRRAGRTIEPWYDWGTIHIERMEGIDLATMTPGGEGPVRFIQLQWFGLHLGFQIGRTPQKWSR